MAEHQDKDLFGVLFKNQSRPTEKHPNLSGGCTIAGRRYRIAGWTRTVERGAHTGQKYLSLAFTPAKDEAARKESAPPADEDILY
jgi:hypothetical protein